MKTIQEFNFGEFVREIYLRSVPSVDLREVEGQVDCADHTIECSVYDDVLREFDILERKGDGYDIRRQDMHIACNMFMLQSGPQLVNP